LRTVSDLEQRLTSILVSQLRLDGNPGLEAETALEEVGLDSLGMLAFIASIEREFGVSISDRDYETLETYGDALALVRRLMA
jgi:acyl carrier protein